MSGAFPEHGAGRAEILAALADARAGDLASDGRAFAFVYDAGEEARALAREAFAACMSINGLDPTVYPSARVIENALVGACLELVRAPEGAVGTATAGGTESVMLAVKAARDHARRTRPEVAAPKMLVPETAHACFHKAAHYLGVELVPVAVDAAMRADVNDARAKMTPEVILVVGSAPSYAHGVVDPIEALAALARERGALMHVDACVGGCVLPFLRELGDVRVPAFDFTVPGVTSLSMDLHKYGYAPKGVSMLLHRRSEIRDAQYFACARWSGYAVVNATTLGSKSVAAMGAALATLRHLGKSGYRDRARLMWDATQRLVRAIDAAAGVRLVTRPDMNLLAFTTEGEGDVFELADRLAERGWHVQPTYAYGRSPAHVHLTIDPTNTGRVDHLARDLVACAADLPPAVKPPPPVLAMLSELGRAGGGGASLPFDAGAIMAQLGIEGGRLPKRAAPIHRLLDAAAPEVRERLLGLFMAALFM